VIARLATWLSPPRARALRDGLILAGIVFNVTFLLTWTTNFDWFVDVHAWNAIDLHDLYAGATAGLMTPAAFHYAPVIAWAFLPMSWLSFDGAVIVVTAVNLIVVTIFGRRSAPILLLAFPPVLLELVNGNIHLLLALAIWAGLRWPAAWAFVFLTKVTPGVGVFWFVGRREWRNLAIALGATLGIAAIGTIIAPGQWMDWIRSLVISTGQQIPTAAGPLIVRAPAAVAVAWFAGRTDRAWLVPVACTVAMPTPWIQSTAILTACFPLYWDRARFRRRELDGAAEDAAVAPAASPA